MNKTTGHTAFSGTSMKTITRALATAAVALFIGLIAIATPAAAAATINVTYTDTAGEGFNDAVLGSARRGAFEAALGIWGARLTSTVPISVTAHFDAKGGSAGGALLASAGPSRIYANWGASTFPFTANTWYPSALANRLAGRDLEAGHADLDVSINSDVDNPVVLGSRDWYYGTDGNGGDDVDLIQVVLHELGHGLGFISFLEEDGSHGVDGVNPGIFDRFIVSGAPGAQTPLLTRTPAQRAAAMVGDQLFFNGTQTNAANGGASAKLFAPATFSGSSSVSHLDETTFTDANECMSPLRSTFTQDIGAVASGVFRDIGWTVGPSDNTPPTVTASSPVAGVLTGFNTPGAGTVSDAPDPTTFLLKKVQVHLRRDAEDWWWSNGSWFTSSFVSVQNKPQVKSTFTSTGTDSGNWSVATVDWPTAADLFDTEDYTLFVIGFDSGGHKTVLSRKIRIDTDPPVVAFSPLANGAGVSDFSSIGGTIAKSNSVKFQITESNAPSADRVWTGSAFSTNLASPFQTGAISGGTWTRGASALPAASALRPGPYRLTVRAANEFGTAVDTSISVNVTAADTIPPVANFTSPISSRAVRTLTIIAGFVEDNPGGSGVMNVRFFLRRVSDLKYWNGSAWVTNAAEARAAIGSSTSGVPTWRITKLLPKDGNLLDGVYYASVVPRDLAGNLGKMQGCSFTVDRAAPVASVVTPANGASITTLPEVAVTGTDTLLGGAPGSGLAAARFTLQRNSDSKFWNGSVWLTTTTPPQISMPLLSGLWRRNGSLPRLGNLTMGGYTIRATVTDRAGNVSAATTSTFTVVAAGVTEGASSVSLSTASAAADGSIRLVFTGTLGAGATNTGNYSVVQNGSPIPVNSAQQTAAGEVLLGTDGLTTGAKVTVSYALQDAGGRPIFGSATVTVK